MAQSTDDGVTRCKCGHVWRPMAWQERTRNVRCEWCGAWNQAGVADIGYGSSYGDQYRRKRYSAGGRIQLRGMDAERP